VCLTARGLKLGDQLVDRVECVPVEMNLIAQSKESAIRKVFPKFRRLTAGRPAAPDSAHVRVIRGTLELHDTVMSFRPRSQSSHQSSLSVAIAPSANGRHLVRYVAPDQPYFHLGDTAWELLHRLSRSEAEYFLRNRAAKGFTAVMVVVLAEHG
jgi:hypothetical protein